MNHDSRLPARLSIPDFLAVLEQAREQKTPKPFFVTDPVGCVIGLLEKNPWMRLYGAGGEPLSREALSPDARALRAMGGAYLRLGDVALGYYDRSCAVFHWADEAGGLVIAECQPFIIPVYVPYLVALKALNMRFAQQGFEITKAALLRWIFDDEVKAKDSVYESASTIDGEKSFYEIHYSHEVKGTSPSIEALLANFFFCEQALRNFNPVEWWLNYSQVSERWKGYGLTESEIDGYLIGGFHASDLVAWNPMPGYGEFLGEHEPSLDLIRDSLYPLSQIKHKEREYRIHNPAMPYADDRGTALEPETTDTKANSAGVVGGQTRTEGDRRKRGDTQQEREGELAKWLQDERAKNKDFANENNDLKWQDVWMALRRRNAALFPEQDFNKPHYPSTVKNFFQDQQLCKFGGGMRKI